VVLAAVAAASAVGNFRSPERADIRKPGARASGFFVYWRIGDEISVNG